MSNSHICMDMGPYGILITVCALEAIAIAGFAVRQFLSMWHQHQARPNIEKSMNESRLATAMRRMPTVRDLGVNLGGNKDKDKSKTEPWEVDYRKIKFKEKLAKGNFGEVWAGTWLGSPIAIKTVISRMAQDQEFIERFVVEIKLMSNLHHPNIVMFLGACVTPVERMCLLLEYCIYGNMHEFLKSEGRDHNVMITLHMVIKFATDIARGVHYIHQKKNIIQRDLKSRNVLIDVHLNAKVADFGLSRLKEEDANLTACGTPAWTAPEIVKMEPYDEKVDVYSFGIVMWELITREEPYGGQGGVQIAYAAAEQGLRPPVPSTVPDYYRLLMERCWAEEPTERPDFGEVLEVLFTMMKSTPNPALKDLNRAKSKKNMFKQMQDQVAIDAETKQDLLDEKAEEERVQEVEEKTKKRSDTSKHKVTMPAA